MNDDEIITPQERRLLSLEERLSFLEKKVEIVTELIADLNVIFKKPINPEASINRLKSLDPHEGPV